MAQVCRVYGPLKGRTHLSGAAETKGRKPGEKTDLGYPDIVAGRVNKENKTGILGGLKKYLFAYSVSINTRLGIRDSTGAKTDNK